MKQPDKTQRPPSIARSIFNTIESRISRLGERKSISERYKSIIHLLAGNLFGSILGLASFALTARALGPADYGILALCFTYTRAIERLVSFQSWQPLIRYGAQALEEEKHDALRSLLKFGLLLDIVAALLGFVIAVALIILASPLIGISPEARSFALLYCLVLPFQVSGMPTAVLRLFGKFSALAYGQVVSSVARLILCGVGLMLSWGLLEFTLMWMAIQIASTLSMNFLAFAALRRHNVRGVLSSPVRGMSEQFPGLWRFAFSANLSLTIRSSAFEFDTLLVGYFADPAAAGFYHIAKRIGRLGLQAGAQVQTVTFPELAKLWSASRIKAFGGVVRQIQWLMTAAGVLLVIIVYFAIEPLLYWTAGSSFTKAAPLVMVQAVSVTLTLFGSVLRSALLAMGLEGSVLYSVMVSTAAFHLTAVLLIPQIGAMGANIAHIALAITWTIMMSISYRNRMRQSTSPDTPSN